MDVDEGERVDGKSECIRKVGRKQNSRKSGQSPEVGAASPENSSGSLPASSRSSDFCLALYPFLVRGQAIT